MEMSLHNGQCGHCATKIGKGHNYCHQCGHILKCPSCSQKCDSSFKYCPQCGHCLQPEKLTVTSDHLKSSLSHDPQLQASQVQSRSRSVSVQFVGVDGAGDRDRQTASKEIVSQCKETPMSPFSQLLHGKAKVTCAVGAYNQETQTGLDMNNNTATTEKTNSRYTAIMKTYSSVVWKLRGEEDFQQPVKSKMKVVVTHVEANGFFFWGQVICDGLKGNRTNLETLARINAELQMEENRQGPVKFLGRCAAMEDGVWYRAWNMTTTSDRKHDVLYIDFGNTASLSDSEVCCVASHMWKIPPMAKPFRLIDTDRNVRMKQYLNKEVTLEILSAGLRESNYVASVFLVPEEIK